MLTLTVMGIRKSSLLTLMALYLMDREQLQQCQNMLGMSLDRKPGAQETTGIATRGNRVGEPKEGLLSVIVSLVEKKDTS